MKQKTNGCGCDENCCTFGEYQVKRLLIEFMYIDLTVCDRCMGTDTSLEDAIAVVATVMQAIGYEIEVRKILVESEQQACELGFVSSPTIRINGKDIDLVVKESLCESCGDVCGEDVDCRVWTWQGQEYTTPPKAMIVDAILRHVYGAQQDHQPIAKDIPQNLKKFFAAKAKR